MLSLLDYVHDFCFIDHIMAILNRFKFRYIFRNLRGSVQDRLWVFWFVWWCFRGLVHFRYSWVWEVSRSRYWVFYVLRFLLRVEYGHRWDSGCKGGQCSVVFLWRVLLRGGFSSIVIGRGVVRVWWLWDTIKWRCFMRICKVTRFRSVCWLKGKSVVRTIYGPIPVRVSK